VKQGHRAAVLVDMKVGLSSELPPSLPPSLLTCTIMETNSKSIVPGPPSSSPSAPPPSSSTAARER